MPSRKRRLVSNSTRNAQGNDVPPGSAQHPSRLKRKRGPEHGKHQAVTTTAANKATNTVAPAATLGPIDRQRLSNLSLACGHLSGCPQTSGEPSTPPATYISCLVHDLSSLLVSVPVSVVLEHVPTIPQVLVRAVSSPRVDISSVIKCLLQFCFQSHTPQAHLADLHNSKTSTCLSAPFEPCSATCASCTQVVDWAVQLVVTMLHPPQQTAMMSPNGVFVGHLDSLHVCVVERMCAHICDLLIEHQPLDSSELDSQRLSTLPALVRYVTSLLFSLLSPSARAKIASSVINTAATPQMAIVYSPPRFASLSDVFVKRIVDDRALFSQLAVHDQATLLHSSECAYAQVTNRLQQKLKLGARRNDAAAETKALAVAAYEHPTIHWKLVDDVRRLVGGGDEPFNLRTWKNRIWMRSTLGTVVDMMNPTEIGERMSPLVRRCALQAAILDQAFVNGGDIQAGVAAARTLHNGLGLNRRLRIGASRQCVLFVLESMVERAVWACGRFVRDRCIDGQEAGVAARDVALICGRLIVATDVLRLPNGLVSESEGELAARAKETTQLICDGATGALRQRMMCALLGIALIAAGYSAPTALWVQRKGDFFEKCEWSWAVDMSRVLAK